MGKQGAGAKKGEGGLQFRAKLKKGGHLGELGKPGAGAKRGGGGVYNLGQN